MSTSYSSVVSRLCSTTGKTLVSFTHGGAAARPRLTANSTTAAICTMGAYGGKLRENLKMRVRAETDSTLMIDSVMPTRLLPAPVPGTEFGIGIHSGVESGALLVITPEAHVPHKDTLTGLWTRYDLSPGASLASVQLADLKNQKDRLPEHSGRYTCRTRVHFTPSINVMQPIASEDKWRTTDSLPYIDQRCNEPSVSSCGLPFDSDPSWTCDWMYGRRFKGLVMGTEHTNVIATVVLAGPRVEEVIENFQNIKNNDSSHDSIGLYGEVHLAVQHEHVPRGELVVVRIGAEYREDMHRLLHKCMLPLEAQLGCAPYHRMIHATKTCPPLLSEAPNAESNSMTPHWPADSSRKMYVQHSSI